ncbi:hypothetical protein [Alteromonas sp. ASW11-130]|uniref:hypothetical protein n=1 Tax=Alteromonas sp. ASW11-130 TaxID=3015775 RepID=UPI002241CF9C|nr:hypothetical protein [Alteromonas sp. ASW11-130]MCW8091418.1 hypothetical protein [Alteromonas sp. ASW11-130]
MSLLYKHNFEVNKVEHPFPLSIVRSTLIYSPLLTNPEALTILESILPHAGYSLSRSNALVEGKHWYTKNNIGFYPIPDDVELDSTNQPIDLSYEYKSKDCERELALTLDTTGRFRLTSQNERTHQIEGTRRVTDFPISCSKERVYLQIFTSK